MAKQIVIKKDSLPPLDANSSAYLIRFRIISEDKSNVSYWSPIYSLPVSVSYVASSVSVNHNSGITVAAWQPSVMSLETVAASGNGTTATLTFATQNVAPFKVGASIVVSGLTPSGYNGTYTVTECTTTTVSYSNTTTGLQTVAGTVKPFSSVDALSYDVFVSWSGSAGVYDWQYYGRVNGTSVTLAAPAGLNKFSIRVFKPSQSPNSAVSSFLIYETLDSNV